MNPYRDEEELEDCPTTSMYAVPVTPNSVVYESKAGIDNPVESASTHASVADAGFCVSDTYHVEFLDM